MVNVKTMGLLDGQFTKLWKKLYIDFSQKPLPNEIKTDTSLLNYISLLSECFNTQINLTTDNIKLKVYEKEFSEEDVIVAFSGGKDSVACVLKLKEDGYNPILFFVDGINRSYNEFDNAKKLSELLNCELFVYQLSVTGKCDFIENPIKNQFILSLMVDYGLKRNINKYALGSVRSDNIKTISKEYMLSDCYELLLETEKYYQKYIKYFELLIPLKNETESFCIINKNKDKHILLNECISCISPIRYRGTLIKHNEEKFNLKLPKNRCGSCYKCCQEAIILNEIGLTSYDNQFIKHCYDIIEKAQEKFDKTSNSKDEEPWIDHKVIKQYKKKGSK